MVAVEVEVEGEGEEGEEVIVAVEEVQMEVVGEEEEEEEEEEEAENLRPQHRLGNRLERRLRPPLLRGVGGAARVAVRRRVEKPRA